MTAIKDLRQEAKHYSEKLRLKNMKDPRLYTVQWDNGKIETCKRKIFWFDGDNPGLGRPVLIDPKKES